MRPKTGPAEPEAGGRGTLIVLVAIVTSLMAPPILRFTMNRVEQTAEERLRLAEHDELVR